MGGAMRILQLTTYDVEFPNHGGKLRGHHIRKSLRERFTVETLSFEWSSRDLAEGLAVELNQDRFAEFGIDGMLCDWGISIYLEANPDIYFRVCELVRSFRPDVLSMEQPFLWPLVKRFRGDGVVADEIKIVYSSHNIEAPMKQKIYEDNYSADDAKRYLEIVRDIELDVIKSCDVALAVSERDAAYIKLHAPTTPLAIYSNGHSRPCTNDSYEKWKDLFSKRELNWIFIGSWHPPNINGIKHLLDAISATPEKPNFLIWVLGGAGDGLRSIPGFKEADYPYLRILGMVSQDDINAGILNSSGVLLPIWEGGGSNLKTAQALLSRKCILGSNFSFRGFENCTRENGVFLGETPNEVVAKLLSLTPESLYTRSAAVDELQWEFILATLPDFLQKAISLPRTGKDKSNDCV